MLDRYRQTSPKKPKLGNVHVSEKSEQMALVEEELNPMNCAKVFANDRFVFNRPKREHAQPKKHSKLEFLEVKAYQTNIEKDA